MIPFLDVKQINKRFEKEYQQAFQSFLESGSFVLGNQLEQFEKSFATYCGARYCLGIGNGLDAITLLFKAYITLGKLNIGDKVLVPANTYLASILAIQQAGLEPVLVEANPDNFNISLQDLEQKITKETKAILVVHLYGFLVDIKAIKNLAIKHNLLTVEDAAQAHGAMSKEGVKAGNLANAAAFSFYPTKNLGALGDGGAITTNDKELYNTVAKLRNYGGSVKYHYEIKGVNSRLDELQASFLSIKLPFLDADNNARKKIAELYSKTIKNSEIQVSEYIGSGEHVYYTYVIKSKKRDELQAYLSVNGIQTVIHYPIPPHKQQALKEFGDLHLPITESLHKEVLSLPISPVQTKEATLKIIEILNNF